MARHITSKNTLNDLKESKGVDKNITLLLGKESIGDGFSGIYYWDDESTEPEDLEYMNVIKANNVEIGRWVRNSVKMLELPQGILVMNGGKKELFINSVTDANSECSVNLTYDGTASGESIFKEIWFDNSNALVNTSNANDIVISARKSLSEDRKVLVHKFARGNSGSGLINLSVGMRNASSGTNVSFKVEGI